MKLEFRPLEGRFVRLEPFAPELKAQVRTAIDCDPQAWAIMPVNPTGDGFDNYWSTACDAPLDERMAYAIRRQADGQVVGMSTYYTSLAGQGGVEIGTTFLRPDVRAGFANPESKLLMLAHAFGSGAVRVQFRPRSVSKPANVCSQYATKCPSPGRMVVAKDPSVPKERHPSGANDTPLSYPCHAW